MSRNTLNLLLLAIVTALVLTVVWKRQQDAEPAVPLVAFGEDDIRHIVVRHPEKPAIELQRDGAHWRITAPFSAPAETVEVAGILNLATLESERQLPAASVDLAELELDPPKYEVQLNDTVLQFGGLEPIEYRRYIRIGDTVHLVPDPPSAALDADPADLVAKQLVPPGRSITQIELPDLTLTKADPGWTLVPENPDASADQMQALADNWARARAMWNETPKVFEAREPDIRITLDDGSVISATIVKRKPQLVLGRPGLGIHQHLSGAQVEQLLSLPPPPEPEGEDSDEPLDADAVVGETPPGR